MVGISRKSFLKEGVEYDYFGDSTNDEFLQSFARVVLKCF